MTLEKLADGNLYEVYSRAFLDSPVVHALAGPIEKWQRYRRKKTLTSAVRIDGAFAVETTEGLLTCVDGWLCIDARGNPYPVAAAEFALIYEPA